MIDIADVSRKYGNTLAVDALSLTVHRGEVLAFLGPNGAGKTTTIKMMVGLLRPSSGQIRLCGYDVARQPREAARRVGYVPDEPHLYDKLSGREVLEFVARMYGLSESDAAEHIERQIEQFELAHFVDRLCEGYSHGMKQRVVFATALIHRPEVLIVDEPMVGLDPRSMRLVKDLLRREAGAGATVFMSTHTLSVAEEIADRIGIINHGKLLFLGTLAELRSQLKDLAGKQTGEDASAMSHSTLEQMYLELTSGELVSHDREAGEVVGTSPQ